MSLNKSKVLRTAEKYVLQGKIPAAIDEYRKVVDADPSDLTTINTLGDLYVRAGRIPDAITNFSRIADSYREGGFTLKAIAMLKKISKLDPTNIETAMKLANLYSQQGLLVEARQQYLQVADAYARAGQTRKALEAYQKIADLDPSNTSVRMKLAEIYSRERMTEQAHEAFIIAGTEFLRKGDIEQALNANLKAIVLNPDSRQALTAIATIYTEQGQTDRAINILCEAFERNPGDIELLTILGRTYLSAGMMDDAERTFLSLVELDKNRYHYLLEVGRRFIQIGDLDRAAEQIDGCVEVLIGKREEDKAIDFLRRILDRDMNHIGALRRLAQIFNRIREDHNLVATLNSLVEAAMKKGDEAETIAALKELARLEPDESLHLQRLYNLGVRDIEEAGSPDVVRATGPLDYQSAAFDDAFVIRQISEAEILAGHGQVDHAVSMLREILQHAPENVQVHLKLKDIYLRAGLIDQAANECMELARIHEARGEASRASDFVAEAQHLFPALGASFSPPQSSGGEADFGWGLPGSASDYYGPKPLTSAEAAGGGLELNDPASDLDWKRYETGVLEEDQPQPHTPAFTGLDSGPQQPGGYEQAHPNATHDAEYFGFSFADIIADDDTAPPSAPADRESESVFDSASSLPSDTMPGALRDELEGIDFYFAQGYFDIARDSLDRLREHHGDHPEIIARYKQLEGYTSAGTPAESGIVESGELANFEHQQSGSGDFVRQAAPARGAFDSSAFDGPGPENEASQDLENPSFLPDTSAGGEMGFEITAIEPSAAERDSQKLKPFLVHKESGPLYPDVFVQFNTHELLDEKALDALRSFTSSVGDAIDEPLETDEPMESLVTELESSLQSGGAGLAEPEAESALQLDEIGQGLETVSPEGELDVETLASPLAGQAEPLDLEAPSRDESGSSFEPSKQIEARPARDELQEIFEELRSTTGDLSPLVDFETHFSLGLAYKDMDLLDEAVEEFQMAFRIAGLQGNNADYIHCCNMLGLCFQRKQMPRVAVMWFQRGLKVPSRPEDEYQALRYEVGLCYEELKEIDKAIDAFTEVYGIDVNYREVGEKLDQLQAAKNAC